MSEWYANGRALMIHERPNAKPVAVPVTGKGSREVRDTIIACVNSYKRNTPSPRLAAEDDLLGQALDALEWLLSPEGGGMVAAESMARAVLVKAGRPVSHRGT